MGDSQPLVLVKSYTDHVGRQFRRYMRPSLRTDECVGDQTADVCTRIDRKANPHLTNDEAKAEAHRRLYPTDKEK